MPSQRKLTSDELDLLAQQGIDTRPYADRPVTLMTGDEIQQQKAEQASKDAGVVGGGIIPTLKSHAGSLVGGGLAGTAGWGMGAALAPETGGLSLLIPALAAVGTSMIGSRAGDVIQKKIVEPNLLGMTPESQQAEEQAAQLARKNYPISSMGTDIVGGALAGGGAPSLRPPIYAAKGIAQLLRSGSITGVENQVYKHAIQNVVTGNALNTAINAGVQLTTIGTIDPGELAGSAVAGALFAQPSPLGTKLNPKWTPIAKVSGAPKGAEVDTAITPTGQNIADVEAYRKSAQQTTDEINASNQDFIKQRNDYNSQLELQDKIAADAKAAADKRALEYHQTNWLTPDPADPNKYVIGDKIVRNVYQTRKAESVKGEDRPEQRAVVQARNAELKKVPIEDMRKTLYAEDLQQRDPTTFENYKADESQRQQMASDRITEIRQMVAEENQRNADATAKAAKDKEIAAAEQERKAQDDQVRKAQEAEAYRQQQEAKRQKAKGVITPNQARVINTPALAEVMPPGGITRENPLPITEGRTLPVAGEPTAEEQQQAEIEARLKGGKSELHQPVAKVKGESAPIGETDEAQQQRLRDEAAKHGVEVGSVEGDIIMPDGGKAKGVSYDPAQIGRRLIGVAKQYATSDTGYHELVHSMLRDLSNHPDPKVRAYAEQLHKAYGGEEPLAESTGKRLFRSVEDAANSSLPQKAAEYFKDAWSNLKQAVGSKDPETLQRNLVAKMRARAGTDTTLPYSPIGVKVGGHFYPSGGANKEEPTGGEEHHQPVPPDPDMVAEGFTQKRDASLRKAGFYELNDPRYDGTSVHVGKDGINLVALYAAEHNKGAGSDFLSKLKMIADKKGLPIDTIPFATSSELQPALERFYTKNGFKPTGDNAGHWRYSPGEPKSNGGQRRYLTPTLKVGEDQYVGKSHAEALNSAKKAYAEGMITDEQYMDAIDASAKEENHVFTTEREGEILDRGGAAARVDELRGNPVGTTKTIHSQELKAEEMKVPAEKQVETADNKFQPVKKAKDDEHPSSFRPTESAIERIRQVNDSPNNKRVADALQQTLAEKQNLIGRWNNPIIEAANKLSAEQRQRVDRALYHEVNEKTSANFMLKSQQEIALKNLIREKLLDNANYRIKINEPVYRGSEPTKAKIDPWYYPTTTEPRIADIFRQNQDTTRIAELTKDFMAQQAKHDYTPEEAAANLKTVINSFQGSARDNTTGNQAFFNAARKAQGIPLPETWRRTDLLRNLDSYFRRQASDNSYYHNIESNHKVASALGYETDAWGAKINQPDSPNISGSDAVKAVIGELQGEYADRQARAEHAVESIATATMLGPLTEVHKTVSTMSQAFPFSDNPVEAAQTIYHAITNIGEGWLHAKQTGKIQLDAKRVGDFFNNQLTGAERLQGLTKAIRQVYTLGGLTDHFTSAFAQASGEYLLPLRVKQANEGNTRAANLIKHLDPTYETGKVYDKYGMIKLASEFANMLHGAKDARTLPSWMLKDNEISAFMKLSSWNIAQTNNFMRNVWTPATKGDFGPLLMSALGATLGGVVIKELRERLLAKKSAIPSMIEIANSDRGSSGNIPALAYNWMAAASFAGFGGILSSIARYPFDFAFKNQPQGATFPLDEVVSNVATTARHVAEAWMNEPNSSLLEILPRAVVDVARNNIQLARVAMNQAIEHGLIGGEQAYRKGLSDKGNDLRRFEMVSKLPFSSQTETTANPYVDIAEKKFKRTEDIGEAARELPGLVADIIKEHGNNPEVMMAKFKGLKTNNYDTMPNMDETPMAFMRYLRFLRNSQGEQAATDRFLDYIRHRAVNEAKAAMVP